MGARSESMNLHPYIGLTGKFPAYNSEHYPSCSHPEFAGTVSHVDGQTGMIVLLADDGQHMMKHMSAFVLDDIAEARRRLEGAK